MTTIYEHLCNRCQINETCKFVGKAADIGSNISIAPEIKAEVLITRCEFRQE
jgi:hypothetical protein